MLAFEVLLKINIQKRISKNRFLCVPNKEKTLCYIIETFSLCTHFPHRNTFFGKFN